MPLWEPGPARALRWAAAEARLVLPSLFAVRENNWPPLPSWCPVRPCFYQDFSTEIPADYQRICKMLYYLWMCESSSCCSGLWAKSGPSLESPVCALAAPPPKPHSLQPSSVLVGLGGGGQRRPSEVCSLCWEPPLKG